MLYCSDGDGGNNPDEKSAISIQGPNGIISNPADSCYEGQLTEYFCIDGSGNPTAESEFFHEYLEEDEFVGAGIIYSSEVITCENGCSDSKCLEAEIIEEEIIEEPEEIVEEDASCEGVVCNEPPSPECDDEGNLVSSIVGQCAQGTCVYQPSTIPCPNGCVNAQCTPQTTTPVQQNTPVIQNTPVQSPQAQQQNQVVVTPAPKKGCIVDGYKSGYELCDPEDFTTGKKSCTTIDGYKGEKTCLPTCDGYGACIPTEFCDDGIVNGPEQCDLGLANLDFGTCNRNCELTKCGDGVIQKPNGLGFTEVCEEDIHCKVPPSDFTFTHNLKLKAMWNKGIDDGAAGCFQCKQCWSVGAIVESSSDEAFIPIMPDPSDLLQIVVATKYSNYYVEDEISLSHFEDDIKSFLVRKEGRKYYLNNLDSVVFNNDDKDVLFYLLLKIQIFDGQEYTDLEYFNNYDVEHILHSYESLDLTEILKSFKVDKEGKYRIFVQVRGLDVNSETIESNYDFNVEKNPINIIYLIINFFKGLFN